MQPRQRLRLRFSPRRRSLACRVRPQSRRQQRCSRRRLSRRQQPMQSFNVSSQRLLARACWERCNTVASLSHSQRARLNTPCSASSISSRLTLSWRCTSPTQCKALCWRTSRLASVDSRPTIPRLVRLQLAAWNTAKMVQPSWSCRRTKTKSRVGLCLAPLGQPFASCRKTRAMTWATRMIIQLRTSLWALVTSCSLERSSKGSSSLSGSSSLHKVLRQLRSWLSTSRR
mmetsp:Transcript_24599/g.44567  ORF Transcript_24599/g.44567 Transcript_24599/m.44567 type:complete len:229 (+) Transcript_24599:1934-2620(+)